ncbi:LytR/AlgR family response regulator transcription factor [Butyrivibrio sp. WCD3002]|uniref:LytR/AlgR family response regulator transcription factor n=1 Tax=Butyrivibrio sp. WCD3002 TaxID=1280676 RepID=UPI0003F57F50|nr:LytTR family DNA-binding domain-containing protein [Butyrivibrio sp. WCD3002]
MRIAICDDEEKVREILLRKVGAAFPEDPIDTFSSGEELLKASEVPDILLLDIKMPGISGMEVAKALRERADKTVIIFITGEEQYVFDSFDVQAFHYLVKPFSDQKLEEVLNKAKELITKEKRQPEKKYVMVNSGGSHIRICLSDVIYAEVFNSKVIVHTTDSDIEYYGRLTELEKLAGEDFFRTHRAYLVHLKFVKKYDATNVYLKKGQALVSKQNYPKLVKKILDYNRREGLF